MALIGERLAGQYPETNSGTGMTLVPLHEDLVRNLRPTLLVLLGAVAFVLLIATANVANMMLARGTTLARARSPSVRRSVPPSVVWYGSCSPRVWCWRSSAEPWVCWWPLGRRFCCPSLGSPSGLPAQGSGISAAVLVVHTGHFDADRGAVWPHSCPAGRTSQPERSSGRCRTNHWREFTVSGSGGCWSPAEVALSLLLLVGSRA